MNVLTYIREETMSPRDPGWPFWPKSGGQSGVGPKRALFWGFFGGSVWGRPQKGAFLGPFWGLFGGSVWDKGSKRGQKGAFFGVTPD